MKSAWNEETASDSWRANTARWFADWMDPAQDQAGNRSGDYQPWERVSLERVATQRSPHIFFSESLEHRFRLDQRRENKLPRLVLCLMAALLYGSVPFWAQSFFDLPASTATLASTLSLLVLVPISLLAGYAQYHHVEKNAAEILLIVAFCSQIAAIEMLRLDASVHGMHLGPAMTSSTLICSFSMIALSFYRRLALFGFFVATVVSGQIIYQHPDARLSHVELFEAILLVLLSLIGSVFFRISARRAWAANNLLQVSATQDVLTGLANRRAFTSHVELHLRSATRASKICAFILLDLDQFKKVNDRYGHDYGDGVLMEIGVCLQQFSRRAGDLAARIGGEEFAIFLYDCNLQGLKKRLEEIVDAVCDLGIDHEDNQGGIVTISLGAVAVSGEMSLSRIYQHADKLLYQAKVQGRNRLVFDTMLA